MKVTLSAISLVVAERIMAGFAQLSADFAEAQPNQSRLPKPHGFQLAVAMWTYLRSKRQDFQANRRHHL